ncbi:hypothetical protein V6N13_109326 [Hibiscus sabdariffa]|uniref:Uncharacterized protein n=1 Tax=Hibiscus sabdariffa TaxID=183260 RepID=A0ABR2FPL6_9ROSI
MERDSGTWSCSNCRTWFCLDKWIVEPVEDQVPLDYEEKVYNPRHWGRFRYYHALFDSRNDPDPVKLCNLFCQKLFEQLAKFTPWEHEIPGWFKVCCDWEIFN